MNNFKEVDEALAQHPKLNELTEDQLCAVKEAMNQVATFILTKSVSASTAEASKIIKENKNKFKTQWRIQTYIRSAGVSASAFYLAGGWYSYLGEDSFLLSAGLSIVSAIVTFYIVDKIFDTFELWANKIK